MNASDDLRRFARLMEDLFVGCDAPKRLKQIRPLVQLDDGLPSSEVAAASGYTEKRLLTWYQVIQVDGLASWLGKKKDPDSDRLKRAKSGIAQMLVGLLAEEHFEALSGQLLVRHGFRIEDKRVGRTDTDYRLIAGDGHAVCRFNIKFHGTLFKQAEEYVGLDPGDCFALATYKIHGALQRQEHERLPFVFLIISVPDYPRELIETNIADEWTWLAAMSGRAEEEAIAKRLAQSPWVADVRMRINASEFRAISARRASGLLHSKLFSRVHALRLRGFNMLFRGAEINMHLSLSSEMIGYSEFVTRLTTVGPLQLAVSLDRGEL